MTDHDERFRCMGAAMRLVVGSPASPDAPAPHEAAAVARERLHQIDARLSRFKPDSELSVVRLRLPMTPVAA